MTTSRISVLDHGFIDVVESYGSDERVIEAARMSTGKGFLGWGPTCTKCGGLVVRGEIEGMGGEYDGWVCNSCHLGNVEKHGDEKLLRFLYENHHATPFEMAGLIIEVQAPIFVFREWHRHRVPFSYNEMSARYTSLPDVNYIPTVARLMMNAGTSNKQAGTVANAEALTPENAERFRRQLSIVYEGQQSLYEDALSVGVPKELARVHLPVGRYSRMRASSNLRGWLNFLALRSDANPGAQWEIRQYGNALESLLAEKFPRTLALFREMHRAP